MSLHGIGPWLESYGAAGLFLAAVLDAFVPLAQVVDPMVVLLSYKSRNPFLYSGIAVAGSTLGNTIVFLLVRSGGDAFVRRRLKTDRRAALERFVEQNGLAAVLAGAILPPPFPLKGIVLLSALAHMPLLSFVLGLAAARVFRYGLESTLAVFYGDSVISFMKERYPVIGLAVAAVLVVGFLLGRRLTRTPEEAAAPAE
jgi:membrane protein YqaA with SNARE-associated domain